MHFERLGAKNPEGELLENERAQCEDNNQSQPYNELTSRQEPIRNISSGQKNRRCTQWVHTRPSVVLHFRERFGVVLHFCCGSERKTVTMAVTRSHVPYSLLRLGPHDVRAWTTRLFFKLKLAEFLYLYFKNYCSCPKLAVWHSTFRIIN